MSLGKAIRRIRKERRLTQAQVARGICDHSYLSLVESDKLTPPLEKIQEIADRLEVSVSQLIPNSQYVEVRGIGHRLMHEATIQKDEQKYIEAWNAFLKVKELDHMAECVLKWRETLSPSLTLIKCMRQTTFLAQFLGEDIARKWDLYVSMGNAYYQLGNIEQSVWTYRDILTEFPPKDLRFRVLSNLGGALIVLMNYEEASEAFLEILSSQDARPTFLAKAHFGYGTCRRYLGDRESAIHHMTIAEMMYKELSDVRHIHTEHALGVLCLDAKEYDKAMDYFNVVRRHYLVEGSDDLSELCEEYARMEFYKGNHENSNRLCDDCLGFIPDSNVQLAGRIFVWKSWNYELLGDSRSAKDCLRAAKSLLGKENFEEKIRYIDINMEIQKKRHSGLGTIKLERGVDMKKNEPTNNCAAPLNVPSENNVVLDGELLLKKLNVEMLCIKEKRPSVS